METFRQVLLGLSLIGFASGCATARASTLAPAETLTLTIKFLGQPYHPTDLYVCGTIDNTFTCVLYRDVEKEKNP